LNHSYPNLASILLPDVLPDVIFLDAVGTLFEVQGSVGDVYCKLAHSFGVDVSVASLNNAFYQSFQASTPAAFPGVSRSAIPAHEYAWWRAIATDTFQRVGVLDEFAAFESFFECLYAHFATAEPWVLYPDVISTLTDWQQLGIPLGIISNFDTRLYAVLQALTLDTFFTSVTLSTEVGAAKPSPTIFAAALQKHNCTAHRAWHIGDSKNEDYQAAQQAGLQGMWLQRGS
jgi:putative hydrolase of the HAD superfamily